MGPITLVKGRSDDRHVLSLPILEYTLSTSVMETDKRGSAARTFRRSIPELSEMVTACTIEHTRLASNAWRLRNTRRAPSLTSRHCEELKSGIVHHVHLPTAFLTNDWQAGIFATISTQLRRDSLILDSSECLLSVLEATIV